MNWQHILVTEMISLSKPVKVRMLGRSWNIYCFFLSHHSLSLLVIIALHNVFHDLSLSLSVDSQHPADRQESGTNNRSGAIYSSADSPPSCTTEPFQNDLTNTRRINRYMSHHVWCISWVHVPVNYQKLFKFYQKFPKILESLQKCYASLHPLIRVIMSDVFHEYTLNFSHRLWRLN